MAEATSEARGMKKLKPRVLQGNYYIHTILYVVLETGSVIFILMRSNLVTHVEFGGPI